MARTKGGKAPSRLGDEPSESEGEGTSSRRTNKSKGKRPMTEQASKKRKAPAEKPKQVKTIAKGPGPRTPFILDDENFLGQNLAKASADHHDGIREISEKGWTKAKAKANFNPYCTMIVEKLVLLDDDRKKCREIAEQF